MAAAGSASAQSTLQAPVGQIVPFVQDTGFIDNPTNQPLIVASFPLIVENSAWLRAYMEDAVLPDGSSVRFTSMTDGETQTLTAKGLTIWSNTSAYFNGDTLLVELIAGPNTQGNRIQIKRLGIDTGVHPAGGAGQCGIIGPDDRTLSNESWSGRIMPVGCSATVYCNSGGGLITAGHCLDGQSQLVMHFNVPASSGNCDTNAPPVADQFPVTNFQFANGGVGNDWGVMTVGTNGGGQTPFVRYGTFRPLAPNPAGNGATASIWGYGLDTTCVRSQVQQFSPGGVTSVQGAYYDISNDVRGGNSGSGYLNGFGQVFGVVTHCRVGGPNISQRIDLPAFVAARASLNPCAGGGTPPVNNNCGSAITVGLGLTTGTTIGATNDAVGTCGASGTSPDVWYRVNIGCAGNYRFDTCGSAYDTVLGLYSACGGTVLACNDDHLNGGAGGCPAGLNSSFALDLTPGTYFVRVSGFNNLSGNFNLNITGTGTAPANDACAAAAPVVTGGVYTGSTTCASNDGSANCAASALSPDVWYTYFATCPFPISFDTLGSAYDTALSVHTGCPGTTANQIACDDDGAGFPFSRITFEPTVGTTYYIRVSGFNSNTGQYQLNVSGTVPSNDTCAAAAPALLNSPNIGSTACATNDGSANCAASAGSPDVWYTYTASCTGTAVIDTVGSGYDTALSVHTGCPGTIGNQIACDDDGAGFPFSRINLATTAGTTYLIRVSGFANNFGDYQLNIDDCTPDNNACDSAVAIGNGATAFSTLNATTDGPDEPGLCFSFGDSQVGSDVWYLYNATCTGPLVIDTCAGATFDTKIAVYGGSTCLGPILVCNDDSCGLQSSVTVDAVAGTFYLIRLGGFQGQQGTGTLTVACGNSGTCPWQATGCTADQDGDEDVDSDDIIGFFANFENGDSCGDQDGDDDVDSDDITIFFNLFEQGGC